MRAALLYVIAAAGSRRVAADSCPPMPVSTPNFGCAGEYFACGLCLGGRRALASRPCCATTWMDMCSRCAVIHET